MECKGIIDNLTHKGTAFQMKGIVMSLDNHADTPEVLDALYAMKSCKALAPLMRMPMCAYAMAVLDLFGAEPYRGNDPDVLYLISYLGEYMRIREHEKQSSVQQSDHI